MILFQASIRKTEWAGFHVAMAPCNFINGCTHCCVQTMLLLTLAPAVAWPTIKILRLIGKASEICEAKEGASSV